jgi:hypothetical protein
MIGPVIISDGHRYVFVEQPHTACTAIQAELVEHYGGRAILWKHATYADFLRVATPDQRTYFIFSGIRNPLDEAVSRYFKYKTDHKGKYSRAIADATARDSEREAFELVAKGQADFAEYLRRIYRWPYDNDTLIHHRRMDLIVRFETLQTDFSQALDRLGLAQVRPLPLVNPTAERGAYLDFYPPDLRPHAIRIFGPFMRKWGYPLPKGWNQSVPATAMLAFRMLGIGRYVVRRYLRRPAGPTARLAARVVMPIWRSATRRRGR